MNVNALDSKVTHLELTALEQRTTVFNIVAALLFFQTHKTIEARFIPAVLLY